MHRLVAVVPLVPFVVVDALANSPPFTPSDPVSLALSGVAKLVLESRLEELHSVEVNVFASPLSALGGSVDGVRVRGTGMAHADEFELPRAGRERRPYRRGRACARRVA
ncbi:hypothetical protein ACHAW5_010365 [Stephanodiscus triporus]|uniref:Uncharacterized protein n=1 Tax=Stephanodiscus triporus TaxID=2934178 RepID=A0ABD3N8I9_9STRA